MINYNMLEHNFNEGYADLNFRRCMICKKIVFFDCETNKMFERNDVGSYCILFELTCEEVIIKNIIE